MKSWAQTYLAGAVFGTALIVAAFVAFVPLVSLQAPQDWSVPGFGLQGSATGGSADVGGAVAVADGQGSPRPGSTSSDIGSNSATDVAAGSPIPTEAPPDPELSTGGADKAEGGGHLNGTTAIGPASAEVIVRNPGSLTPKGADAPSPPSSVKPTEPSGAPGSAATGEEGRGGSETTTGSPIPAGVITEEEEEPEVLPPPVEAPVPPDGNSPETGAGAEPTAGGDENGVAQSGDGDVPVDSGLELEPGAGGAEIMDRGLADPTLAAPGLVDVTADRQDRALRFDR